MSERKLTNAYWMEVGALRERERIIGLPFVHELFAGEHPDDCNTCYNIALIRGDYDA
jgi:hypothetical protein